MLDVQLLLQCGLRIEALMEQLVAQQRQAPLCCRCVMLAVAPAAIPEEPTYNRFGAAKYLQKSERSVTRWRKAGRLGYVMEGNEIRYPESILDAFFPKIWGFPKKKDDKKKDDK